MPAQQTIPADYQRIVKSERHAVPGSRRVGPADPSEALPVTIRVRRRLDAPPMPDLADPNRRPGAAIDRESFAGLYGASPEDLKQVEDFARGQGLSVTESSVDRRTVTVSGTTGQVSHAFAVDLGNYESPDGNYRGREGFVHLPNALQGVVEGVFGLDNRRMARRHAAPAQGISPLTPMQVAKLYNFPSPGNAAGQTIGLIEFAPCGYKPADIQKFFTANGLQTPSLTDVGVNGASNSPGGGADSEVALDIDVSGAVAQGAQVAVYFTTWDENGWIKAITTAVHPAANQPKPSVISISWDWAEFMTFGGLQWSQAAIDAVSSTFHDAAALGITILVASGDDGSRCQVSDGKAHCYYPASDPWITCCGGTTIQNVAGSSFAELTWNDNGITGGGISDMFPVPAWQSSAGIPASANPAHNTGRGIPDIAGYANGYTIYLNGAQSGPWWGTSETAPLYDAGLVALVNANLGYSAGYLNPALYKMGGTPVFRDIADNGSNAAGPAPGYKAGPKWDACTGWGSLDGGALLTAIGNVGLDWASMGAPAAGILGAPVVTNDADGRLEVFAVDKTGVLWHVWQTAPNNGWSAWTKLPTASAGFSGPPGGALRNADGRIEVFTMGPGGTPFHVWQTAPNGGWTTGASMGKPAGGIMGGLAVARNADGRLEAFGIATDHKLWHIWQTVPNGGWSAWATLGGPPSPVNAGDPRVSINQNGRLAVFVLAQDGNVYTVGQTSSGWSGWSSLGQPGAAISNGAPFVGRNQDGRMEMFATGADGSVYHKWQTAPSGGWSGWALLAANPPAFRLFGLGAVGNEKDGCLSVFTIGSNGALWNCRQSAPNGGWRPWLYLGAGPPSQAMNGDQIPAVGSNADGRLETFVRGADSAMWHIWETSPDGGW